MTLLHHKTCSDLPQVPSELAARIVRADRSAEVHRAFHAQIEALHLIEVGGECNQAEDGAKNEMLAADISVVAWNMQRCLYPEQSADLLREMAPDIVLVSEMDCGMARTHQRHTIRALADSLGMRYRFGVEFFELGLGNEIEQRLAADSFNSLGWHGNGLLSRVEPIAQAMVRLDDHGHWFCMDAASGKDHMKRQPRIGGRMAVLAILPGKAGDICVASTHFESHGGIVERHGQMERLMAAIDAFAPGLPVIIGGDLNAGNRLEKHQWQLERFFDAAERRGYSWENNAPGTTTRKSPLSLNRGHHMKLDWFCSRGLQAKGADILPALDIRGTVLSDHEVILGHFAVGEN